MLCRILAILRFEGGQMPDIGVENDDDEASSNGDETSFNDNETSKEKRQGPPQKRPNNILSFDHILRIAKLCGMSVMEMFNLK